MYICSFYIIFAIQINRMKNIILLISLFISIGSFGQKYTLSGSIRDASNGEDVYGATVRVTDLSNVGTNTNAYGYYSLTLDSGQYTIEYRSTGFETQFLKIDLTKDITKNIELKVPADVQQIDEVKVNATKENDNITSSEMNVTRFDPKSIETVPVLFGEKDIMKTLQLTPGVKTAGEGNAGFFVRGGGADQNLILLDEAPVYNASHLLGFFSVFNSDAIKDVALYKSGIPAEYGGRASSVMDVKMRDGNDQEFKIKGGVGPVTSRLSIEGPIVKDKVSFIVGGRASYADWILNLVRNVEVNRSSVFFYDANLRLSAKLNKKNTLILSGYAAEDEFTYNEEFGFDYATYMGQLTLKTIFNQKSFSNFSLIYSNYKSSRIDFDGISSSRLENNINYLKLKELFTFSPSTLLKIEAGLSGIL